MSTFGIDLGTTNSSISRLSEGRPVALPVDGGLLVPSVVLFDGDRVVVGREARNLELQNPGTTLRSVKRRMGQEHRWNVKGREVSPEEASAEILKALRRGAQAATGEDVTDVVITVPAYFDDAQRRATLRAGELAGLHVLRLLNEPTAASLVYDQVGAGTPADSPQIVLVYDLGGGTFDVSVLEVFQGVREVRSTAGNTHLGGDDFDDAIVGLCLEDLRKRGVDVREDLRAMARLRRAAEEAKIRLSRDTETQLREEYLAADAKGAPVHLDLKLTRRRFEGLVGGLLESTIALARQAIADAKLGSQPLSRVLLVGGSTRIPLARRLLAEAFDADIHEEVDPDLAVALGAGVQAALLAGADVGRILVDVASHTLGIRVVGPADDPYSMPDTFAPVLPRNTVLPAARTEEFYTVVEQQKRLQVEVFQGEAPRVSQNTFLGDFLCELQPAPAQSPIRVEFAYDLDGIVKVSVSQPGTTVAHTVALSVADASARGPGASPLERKARRLLEELGEPERGKLEKLLAAWTAAAGPAREMAEDELLDFLMDQEPDPGGDGDELDEADDELFVGDDPEDRHDAPPAPRRGPRK